MNNTEIKRVSEMGEKKKIAPKNFFKSTKQYEQQQKRKKKA